jgi:hypothetical protein
MQVEAWDAAVVRDAGEEAEWHAMEEVAAARRVSGTGTWLARRAGSTRCWVGGGSWQGDDGGATAYLCGCSIWG